MSREHGASDGDAETSLSVGAYAERIGLDPATLGTPDVETLTRIQSAHVQCVPFENLAIVGDPHGDEETSRPAGEGVRLSVPHLYEKVVEKERGGFCFELNGLVHVLLAELGYDVERVAARVLTEDGSSPPANHHVNVVELDERYLVDVGTGAPMMRRPTPLDGRAVTDDVGVEWRVRESDRPDEEFRVEMRASDGGGGTGDGDSDGDGDEWSTRYVFSDVPRDLSYFEATCEYLQTAPESTFTGGPIVAVSTPEGYRKLSAETLTDVTDGEETERDVAPDEWTDVLSREFGLDYDWE